MREGWRRGGLILTLGLALGAAPGAAQDQSGVDGRVFDVDGRSLRAVSVLALDPATDRVLRTVSTDASGYFRVEPLDPGEYLFRFLRLGYEAHEEVVTLGPEERVRLEVQLVSIAIRLEGIQVEGERTRARARFQDEAGVTTREVTADQIRLLPGLAESDPVRAIEFLPGVVAPTDFSASFNVRGGSADQNLILLDGFPLFNPFHLGGIFSVFNADLVDRVELSSGGFPAEFGGRVSSVLRVESDPGPGEFRVDGGVSILAARAAISGGLPDGLEDRLGLRDGRYRVAVRRSYADRLLRPVATVPYVITDLQGIFEGWSKGGDRWTITGYAGRDVLDLGRVESDDFPLRLDLDWGNRMLGARWLRPLDAGGALETRAGVTEFSTGLTFPDFDDSRFESRIRQITLHGAGNVPIGGRWNLKAGLSADHFDWGNRAAAGGTLFVDDSGSGWNTAAFAQTRWNSPGAWIIEGGVRFEGWIPEEGPKIFEPSPRLSVKRFIAGGDAAIKGSAGRYVQFLHSVRDEELPLGIDFWVTAGDHVSHVVSDQVQLGIEAFPRPGWFVSLDGYYREFDGVITTNLAGNPNDPDDGLLSGEGRSYGVDLFVERAIGVVDGSFSLSWLRADRTFPDFISGREERPDITYSPIFDRRLDADLVLRFPLLGQWEGGVRWHIGSGIPYTRPMAAYAPFTPRQSRDGALRWLGLDELEGEDSEIAILLGPRNAARYPTYQRLDFSARRDYERSWGRISPYLDILNVYNQPNVLFYFYDFRTDPPERTGLSMFPLLPTVGVEVRF
jgi:hypothetical protein